MNHHNCYLKYFLPKGRIGYTSEYFLTSWSRELTSDKESFCYGEWWEAVQDLFIMANDVLNESRS